MRLVLPRVIHGNRGDLISRWGLLYALDKLNKNDVTVFADAREELPAVNLNFIPYGRFFNLFPNRAGWRALREADVILWAVGLDLQDESSIGKLVYLDVLFSLYKRLGLKIWCLFQGAGPLGTMIGKTLARRIIGKTDLFVARDPGTYQLIGEIAPCATCVLSYDSIFVPGVEAAYHTGESHKYVITNSIAGVRPFIIGFNIRQWFHFASRFIPYEFNKAQYLRRSAARMRDLVASAVHVIQSFRDRFEARVILLSAYQSNVVEWEGDLQWLAQVKAAFPNDAEVVLMENNITLTEYLRVVSQLDVMVAMRLHSCLAALRVGVPAVNINYTLKGRNIMHHLSLGDRVVELEEFLNEPNIVTGKVGEIAKNREQEVTRLMLAVARAVECNGRLLDSLFGDH